MALLSSLSFFPFVFQCDRSACVWGDTFHSLSLSGCLSLYAVDNSVRYASQTRNTHTKREEERWRPYTHTHTYTYRKLARWVMHRDRFLALGGLSWAVARMAPVVAVCVCGVLVLFSCGTRACAATFLCCGKAFGYQVLLVPNVQTVYCFLFQCPPLSLSDLAHERKQA